MTQNTRQKTGFNDLFLIDGADKDLFIGWQEIYVAAASLVNGSSALSGSLSVATIGGCNLNALRFTSTSHSGNAASGFPFWITKPVPQDAAIAAPAAASGTIYIDWTNPTTAAAVAVVAASLFLVPNGSSIGDSGTSTIATACTTLTGAAASEFNSTSLVQFNAPTTRNAYFAFKMGVAAADEANTSGSNFHLFGVRLRYKADRIGS